VILARRIGAANTLCPHRDRRLARRVNTTDAARPIYPYTLAQGKAWTWLKEVFLLGARRIPRALAVVLTDLGHEPD